MNDLLILKGAASAHDTTKERRIGGEVFRLLSAAGEACAMSLSVGKSKIACLRSLR
jgi:hypothetical protein